MAENNQDVILAKQNFKVLCDMLDGIKWNYKKDEQEFKIDCNVRGKVSNIAIRIKLNQRLRLATLYAPLDFKTSEQRRKNLAIAVSRANQGLVDGDFDYKYFGGKILFRLTASYAGCVLSKEAFEYILYVSCSTVDHYVEKFIAVSEKDMTVDEVIKLVD